MRNDSLPLRRDLWAWAFALALSGYPLVGLLASYYQVEDSALSVGFRSGVCLLCLIVFLRSRARTWRTLDLALLAFLVVYATRVIADLSVGTPRADFALTLFVGSGVVPALLLTMANVAWNERNAAKALLCVGICVAVPGLWLMEQGAVSPFYERLGFERLNPITLGHAAVTTAIASIVLLFSAGKRVLPLLGLGLSLGLVFYTGSRGPVMALCACAALLGFVRYPRITTGLLSLALYLWMAGVLTLQPLLEDLRFSALGLDTSSASRIVAFQAAIEMFNNGPIFGSSFQLPIYLYPHNIFADVLMSTGLVGAVPFLLATARAIGAARLAVRGNQLLLPLLLAQLFVGAQFSGALWNNSGIIIAAFVTLGLIKQRAVGFKTQASPPSSRGFQDHGAAVFQRSVP